MDEIKQKILTDLLTNAKLEHEKYDLVGTELRVRNSQLAMHLYELKEDGYVDFKPRAIHENGHKTEYGKEVLAIYSDEIELTTTGRSYANSVKTS